jgi:hypothetical protein
VLFGWGLGNTTFLYATFDGFASAPLAPNAAFLAVHTVPTSGTTFAPLRGTPYVANFTPNVRNTDARDSDEVVLGFLRPSRGGAGGIPSVFRVFLFAVERGACT